MAKEMIAMLLAGGQGSRLYALTQKLAKPAVPFGGKYRIIDFPLSNCVNSGIDTVGILTQYLASRYFHFTQSRSLVTSGGLGTMGFGLPAAIGAKIGPCLFIGCIGSFGNTG